MKAASTTEKLTRTEAARRAGSYEQRVREWEAVGLLAPFGSVPDDVYVDRVRLIVAARRLMSMQRLRLIFAVGGGGNHGSDDSAG